MLARAYERPKSHPNAISVVSRFLATTTTTTTNAIAAGYNHKRIVRLVGGGGLRPHQKAVLEMASLMVRNTTESALKNGDEEGNWFKETSSTRTGSLAAG